MNLEEAQKICYEQNFNYKEEILDASKKLCFCFFSSHGIYYPDTIEEFNKKIVCDDYYDWQNIARSPYIRKRTGKILFFRDIYKQFYVEGINSNVNSVDALVELIKNKTKGYTVICCGSSGGGYIASLVGSKIQCYFVLSLSGQFSLYSYGATDKMPLIKKHLSDKNYSQYYDITPLVHISKVPIIYLYANMCEADLLQYNEIKEADNVFCFAFRAKEHASTCRGEDLPRILLKDVKKLQRLHQRCNGKVLTQKEFAVKLLGIHGFLWQKICKRGINLVK